MNSPFEHDYKQLIAEILATGSLELNRTGVPAYTLFGKQLRFDASTGLCPVITGKKIFHKKAWHEYIWIREGGTTLTYLHKHKIKWWDEYADIKGNLPKTYGHQLRNYNGEFDQLQYCINQIKSGSRRAHITMWNPCDLKEQKLPCCYTGLTFTTTLKDSVLNLAIDFRSSDVFLGLPYDILFGFYMLHNVAEFTGKKLGEVVYNLNNAHIYHNHIEVTERYLSRETYDLPTFVGGPHLNYKHGPYIQAKLNN